MTHDGAPSAYTCNTLEQLSKQTDAKSASDTSPQMSTFTYTPAGQVLNAVKPNGNKVANTYYANELPSTVTEKTSGGTLVCSHQYSYNPDGNALGTWLAASENDPRFPELASFALGIRRDHDAVVNGLTLTWNSGLVEGLNTRTKLLKRKMYGRATFALLRKRILTGCY
jgi:hypothetical protein